MRMYHSIAAPTLTLALILSASPVRAEAPKSGPHVGELLVGGSFQPLNVTGAKAGEKHCLFCENGLNPVAMIFARELSEPLTALIKKIDDATGKNSDCHMGSFVVFLNDDEGLEKQLKEFAKKNNLRHTVLSIDSPAGPPAYKIAKDADVTVLLYTAVNVKASYAFKKGQLTDKDVDRILADLPKILFKEGELSFRKFQPCQFQYVAGAEAMGVFKNTLAGNPLALVLARETSEPLSCLIAKLDAAAAKHQDCNMGSIVMFLSDDPELGRKLKETAAKAELRHTVLAIDDPAGPKGYKIAKDAEITVVLFTKLDGKASYAFKKGEMTDKDVDRILADLKKLLPEK